MSANAGYVAVSWNDNSVHFLDNGFNDIGSFAITGSNPNGVATDGTTIWVGTPFADASVRAYDFSGTLLYSWSRPCSVYPYNCLENLQAMELVNGKLAIYNDAGDNQVRYFDPTTGALLPGGVQGSYSTEGLAFDGSLLWQLADSYIYGWDISTNTQVAQIANAAVGWTYSGTGMTFIGGGTLALACSNGNWYTVSTADGSVISSGNNGLNMFGLKYFFSVPEPGTLALLGLGLAGLGLSRRRRMD